MVEVSFRRTYRLLVDLGSSTEDGLVVVGCVVSLIMIVAVLSFCPAAP